MIEQLETRYGTMFVPDTDNGQYWWLKTISASPEHEMISFVCEMLEQMSPGIAVDVGANFGCWSLPLAAHTKVIAIEPQRCVLSALKQTLSANPDLPITLIECALGSEPGTARLPDISLDNSTNFGGVSIDIPHSEHPSAPMYDVPMTTLDKIMERWSDETPVSFIKFDIEGSELNALKGAERTIRRWKPVMIVEADHPLTDTNALGALIESFGYNVEIFQDNNFIAMPV